MRVPAFRSAWLLALGACATPTVDAELPFHVAVAPVAIAQIDGDANSMARIALTFESAAVSEQIVEALDGSFLRVSALSPLPDSKGVDASQRAWIEEARRSGADLILDATLSYEPVARTGLNDWFWSNLALFAFGGPFSWFVEDRSYYFQSRLQGEVHDLTVASREGAFSAASRVVRIDEQIDELTLNFLDRADWIGPFALSIVVPAGFISSESADVPGELRHWATKELGDALSRALRDRGSDLTRGSFVKFYPQGVEVRQDADERALVGEFVLEIGDVSELGELRYRIDDGSYAIVEWGEPVDEQRQGRAGGRRRYPFRIPVGESAGEFVQLEVEQLDSDLTKRTFTYPLRSGTEWRQ